MDNRVHKWMFSLVLLIPLFFISSANAALNETCVVNILNRTIQVDADGGWSMPNVPSNMGRVRARATCVQNGLTVSGQSDYFTITRNGISKVSEIVFQDLDPIPSSLEITPTDSILLNAISATTQLTVTATYQDGSTQDVTASTSGINYSSTNPAIASVTADGLVTAISSGSVLLSARKDGAIVVKQILVSTTGDQDGDGLPDDFEQANGLNPNDPIDALEDQDGDGLSALDEYNAGTEINVPDTDGDGISDGEELIVGEDGYITNPLAADSDGDMIPDGLEIIAGSNPNDSASFDLTDILVSVELTPSNFVLVYNTIMTEATSELSVMGTFIDGTTLDLTSKNYGTDYSSSDLTVASFGLTDGLVFAGVDGAAVITATTNGLSDTAAVTVTTFSPTALGYYSFPSSAFANNVDVEGQYAYVAAGAGGLYVLDISAHGSPSFVASVDTPGNANDVKISGDLALVADGVAGLQVIDISTPTAPTILGSVDTTNAWDVTQAGSYVYLADGTSGLRIVDVTDPTAPVLVGTVDTPGTAKGVDLDSGLAIAVVADGSTGVQIVDISNPAAPQIIGAANTNGNARDVAIQAGSIAYVADYTGGLKSIDFSTPSAPVITKSVGDNYLMDIVSTEKLAFGAEVFRVNAAPIYDVSMSEDPVFRALMDFGGYRDDDGTGIDVDNRYLYLTTSHGITENGSTGYSTRLYVGQYRVITDTGSVAPTVSITSPLNGDELIEGSTIAITAAASDDVAVAAVVFMVDDEVGFVDTSSPYEYNYTVPLGEIGLTISAEAIDFANNISQSDEVVASVIPDPPPLVTIMSPVEGEGIIAGSTVNIVVEASDNTNVTVEFLIDGTVVNSDSTVPYEYKFAVPSESIGAEIVIGAKVMDAVGNTALNEVTNIIVPDPLTTVIGVVLNLESAPVSGVSVTVNSGLTGLTNSAGAFSISGVPTVLGDIVVSGFIDINGELFNGSSLALPPVLGGVTDVGSFMVSQDVLISDFESKMLAEFDVYGAVSVTQSRGSQSAPEGQYMAYMHTGSGSVGDYLSRIVTNTCINVPLGMNTLVFEYNFLSHDYPPYNDAFDVIVRSSLGQQTTVLASVNMNYQEIIDSSTGYEWMTGFKTALVDVSDMVNGGDACSLQVEFRVYDAGDTGVDSAILIDYIRFE